MEKKTEIVILVLLKIKEEKKNEFLSIAGKAIEATLKEPGCIKYILTEDFQNPCNFHFIEEWVNEDAITSHFSQPHFIEFVTKSAEFRKEPPEILKFKINEKAKI